MISKTPHPPYYAVIFTSKLGSKDSAYQEMAEKMVKMAQQVEGFLGIESSRDSLGITVSYWKDLESIDKWRKHSDHKVAKKMGIEKWYEAYALRISKVESDQFFEK